MKIYTQTGDKGKTGLLSGERVFKSHVRIRAYGEADELNAAVGALAATLSGGQDQIKMQLVRVQSDLFQAGAWLSATPGDETLQRLTPLGQEQWRRLEGWIDHFNDQLPELRTFILPGGSPAAAWAHMARTICRRVERVVVELAHTQAGQPLPDNGLADILIYLNRLSDYFFVLARHLNHSAGVSEAAWKG
ncbi:MAG: cob(I)yrinic acid a,c-diamide adenosyltransferase [Desulfatitalea sp.]|nr:cob(I)yrinic acid a,c-diamide adenosyltransferase [Desulfatitalea sp.]NNJ99885.1 cob(I)yrinic acid a,c-diamide adenosyltransferase [Desulfatitalea sp.]